MIPSPRSCLQHRGDAGARPAHRSGAGDYHVKAEYCEREGSEIPAAEALAIWRSALAVATRYRTRHAALQSDALWDCRKAWRG